MKNSENQEMDKRQFFFSEYALREIRSINLWYEEKALGLGEKFQNELFNTIEKICLNPDSFARISRRNKIRRCVMDTYPYKIYFNATNDPMEIIAVIHTSRSNTYIKRRLK